jgi:hypothetical protein
MLQLCQYVAVVTCSYLITRVITGQHSNEGVCPMMILAVASVQSASDDLLNVLILISNGLNEK